eukprot:Awhi_evm1s6436
MCLPRVSETIKIDDLSSSINRAINPRIPIQAAAIDCVVVPLCWLKDEIHNQKWSDKSTLSSSNDVDKKFIIYNISSPLPYYYSLERRCYRREISILIPLDTLLKNITTDQNGSRDSIVDKSNDHYLSNQHTLSVFEIYETIKLNRLQRDLRQKIERLETQINNILEKKTVKQRISEEEKDRLEMDDKILTLKTILQQNRLEFKEIEIKTDNENYRSNCDQTLQLFKRLKY